jgi:acyl-CoA synthetase (AMP-forming)/AMP-acid ligase II
VDDRGQVLSPETKGEIWIRGGSVTPGYWNDHAATRDSFHEGWFRTGDVGYLDSDGYLYITDRKKDLIIKGGENISPSEIESVLYMHPAIAEAAVVGVPNDHFGEDICAVIQLRPGAQATEREISEHVARHLNKFKVPAHVLFQPALPRTVTGKINKQELRKLVADSISPLHAA